MQHEMWKVQIHENSKASLDPEEECELKWRRWKNFLHGIVHHLKHGSHSDLLGLAEKQVVEEWSKCFSITAPGYLRQLSRSSGTELTPVTSYLECFKRISECHVRQGPFGRVEHLDFQGTLGAALDGRIWPMAEDDVHEYLKLCFQCRLPAEKKDLALDTCHTSYKADLPLCFLGPARSSTLFCREAQNEEMLPSKDLSSRDHSIPGADSPADPISRKGGRPKSSVPSQQSAKGNLSTKSMLKTLAKAKKTLIRANTEQGKKKRKTKEMEPMDSPAATNDHSDAFEPITAVPDDGAPATSQSTSRGKEDYLEKDPKVEDMNLENGQTSSKKRVLPEEFGAELDRPNKKPKFGLSEGDRNSPKGVPNKAPVQGGAMEMGVVHDSKTSHTQATICSGCGFRATGQILLSDHFRLGSSTKKRHKCCLCSFTCKSFEKFSNHVEKVHALEKPAHGSDKAPLVCPFCPYVVAVLERGKYDTHVESCKEKHENNSNLKPKKVNKDVAMSQESTEASHVQDEAAREDPTDDPSDVTHSEPLKASTPATISQDHLQPSKAFPQIYNHLCEICCTLWDSPASLEQHLSRLHKIHLFQFPFKVLSRSDPVAASPKPFFSCSTCEDRFWSAKGLAQHAEFVHGSPAEKISHARGHCSKWRKTDFPGIASYMARHHVTIADMLLARFCAFCTKNLSCPRSFETHMLTVHKSDFTNRQGLYSALFSQISDGTYLPPDLSSLIETLKCHTPSSSFIALLLKYCTPKEQGQKSYRRLCRAGVEERERRRAYSQGYQCPHCECEFTMSQDVTSHVDRYHRMKCTGCGDSFTSRCALDKHIQLYHRDVGEHINAPLTSNVAIMMDTFEKVGDDFKVGPSDWKPSCSRPLGKIPLYMEDSSGTWVPRLVDPTDTGPDGMTYPAKMSGQ